MKKLCIIREEESKKSEMLQEHVLFPNRRIPSRAHLVRLQQQRGILQSCTPEAPSEATQSVEPQLHACYSIKCVRCRLLRFCRAHLPSSFSFRKLRKESVSFHNQRQWQALRAGLGAHQTSTPSGNRTPGNRQHDDLLIKPDMGDACNDKNSFTLPEPTVEGIAARECALEDANGQPHLAAIPEDFHLATSNPADGEGLPMAAGKTTDLHGFSLSKSKESSSLLPSQLCAGPDTTPLHNKASSKGDNEAASNLQLALVLPKRSNYLSAAKCHSDTQMKDVVAISMMNLNQGCLSIEDNVSPKLQRFSTAMVGDEFKDALCASKGAPLHADLSFPTYAANKRAIVAVENSDAHTPLQSICNERSLQPWQAVTPKAAHVDNNSNTQDPTNISMEWALEITDDNFHAVQASSNSAYVKNALMEKDSGAFTHVLDATSLHHVAAIHEALSILERGGHRGKRRRTDAKAADTRNQINALKRAAMLNLIQARITLSQIALGLN